MKWIVEYRQRETPQSIHVRDAYAAGHSMSAKRASFLAMSLMSMIAGKMTCILQLTDTDVAAPLKRSSEQEKKQTMSLRRDEAMAVAEGVRPRIMTTREDMLRIALAGHEHVEKLNAETDLLLAGLRRNGFLHWRPCPRENRLVRMSEAAPEFCKKRPERSHRIPESWWADREPAGYNGESRPEVPNMSDLGKHTKKPEDMMDECPEQAPNETIELHCTGRAMRHGETDDVELEFDEDEDVDLNLDIVRSQWQKNEAARVEALLSKMRERDSVEMRPGGKTRLSKLKKRKMRLERKMMRKAETRSMVEWRGEVLTQYGRYSRQQLMSALVPEAGRTKAGRVAESKRLCADRHMICSAHKYAHLASERQ